MSKNMVPLGEVVDFIGGGTPSRDVNHYWNGEIPWASVKDFKGPSIDSTLESITHEGLSASSSALIPAGHVIMPTRMALGKAAINSIDVAINQDLKALKPKARIDTRYLLHAILSRAKEIQSHGKGATVQGITIERLRAIKVPLPPLEEQRRIAAILDKAGSLQKLSQSAITKLHQTLESSFRRLSTITACNCASKRLEEVVEAIIDYRGKSPEKTAEGIPLITARLIKEGRILGATEFIAPESYSEWMRRGMPKQGDVVFTTEAPLGQVAQIDNPDVALAQRLVLLRGKSKELDNTYLRFALRMNSVAEQIRKRATGSTVLGIRQKELRQIEIPLPALEVQRDFARLALAIEGEIQRLRQRADSVQALKDSLANRLMEE
jgi:type I restriction enzyme S subunit